MTKAKPVTPKSQASTPKGNMKGVKNTPIGKNKTPKFKATPTGKVALINGTPKSANKQNTGNGTPKGKQNNSPANTPKNKGNNKVNTPKNKQNSPQGKKNTPKGKSPAQKKAQEQLKAAKIIEKPENDDESDDSDEDINEGVEINEDVSDEEVDSDAADESEDDGIKGILGNSLAEDSDDDDADFDDDDDDDEDEEVENKGVKKFKGLQPSADDEDEEDEDDSEDDDDDSLNDSGPGLKALLGQSLAEDDDDEDFSGNDDDEDDDDDDISDDEEDETPITATKNQKALGLGEADEDEDDDEEDSDDEEDDTETSKLSILEDNSEDDEEDEEDDNKTKTKKSKSKDDSTDQDDLLTPEEIAEREKRTIYIGNLPLTIKKGELLSLFKQFGAIDTVRIRGAVPKDNKSSKKVAGIKKDIHPVVPALRGFIRFTVEDSATKALTLNGHKLNGHYLRIDLSGGNATRPDSKKAIFLGNLPFKIGDNAIWDHFADCGKIISVRIVRDNKTGVGKGFGYVNFESPDSVALALKLSGTSIQDREIRVQPCSDQAQSTKKQGGQKRPHPPSNQGGSPKKYKANFGDKTAVAIHNSQNAERRKENAGGKQNKRSQGEQQRQSGNGKAAGKPGGGFQGQKADNKKKPKFNKGDHKKKQVAAKLTAKSKKPSAD